MYSPRQVSGLCGIAIFAAFLLVALLETGAFIAQAPARGANILVALVLGTAAAAAFVALSVYCGLHLAQRRAAGLRMVIGIVVVYLVITAAISFAKIPTHAVLVYPGSADHSGSSMLVLTALLGSFNLFVLPGVVTFALCKIFGGARRVA